MKSSFLLIFPLVLSGQDNDHLNTAKNCSWMKDIEKEMILEINILRSDPAGYVKNLQEYCELARKKLMENGRGEKGYSVSRSFETINGKERLTKRDTTWYYGNEEELKAIESLITELKNLKPLNILQPDKGLYSAAVKHANDQTLHQWSLGHRGSDGSWPWDRIRKYSAKITEGNENLAGKFPEPTAKDIVIQLLIDSGIPGYGHRENILKASWTHVACYCDGLHEGMYRWIQEFGKEK